MEPPLRWSSVTLPGRVKKHLRTLISTSKELEGVVPGSEKDTKVGVVWSWPWSWVGVSEVLVSSSGRETNTIRQAAVILRNQGSDAPPVASRTSWIFCVGAGITTRLQEDTWNSQHVHGLARQCQAGQSTAGTKSSTTKSSVFNMVRRSFSSYFSIRKAFFLSYSLLETAVS